MRRFASPLDEGGVVRPRSPDGGEPDGSRGRAIARLLGAAGLLVLTFTLYWLLSDDGFRVHEADVIVTGVELAVPAAVRDHIGGISRSPNVFRVRAGDIVRDLGALPEVRFARAEIVLPDEVSVEVVERLPIFIWSNGGDAWFVDGDGVLFSPGDAARVAASARDAERRRQAAGDDSGDGDAGAGDDAGDGDIAADTSPGPSSTAGVEATADAADGSAVLPIIEDARIVERSFVPGDRLPAIDFAVMRQLLGITPEFIGSQATDISLRIDEHDGYVLGSDSIGWQAVFGHFRATVQPPEVVPAQVQCLAALFATRPERKIDRVRLVVSGGSCGTFRMVAPAGSDA